MHKLAPIVPDTVAVRALAQLVECRRKLVQDRVDLTNSLTYYLKSYFPQVLDWFKEKDSHVFCDFVSKWPSLKQVQRARKKTFVDFMHQHNVRYADVIKQRFTDTKSAMPLTDNEGVVVPNQLMAELEANQLKVLLQSIERIEQEINKRYRAMVDRKIFDSFPGAGAQLAPRLLVAFGSETSRYESASAMQNYAGIAPVVESSGTRSWTHWRYACLKFLRQTFVEWAGPPSAGVPVAVVAVGVTEFAKERLELHVMRC